MKLKEATAIIEDIAPLNLGEEWDNNGIQISTGKEEINKIMFALELNNEVIEEAIMENVDLIVTHHPLFFTAQRNLKCDDIVGDYAIKLIKADINLYASHTAFDKAPLGNNFYMADLLQLENVEDIEGEIGIKGDFSEKLTFEKAIAHVKEALNLPDGYIRSVGDMNRFVKSVALCTGAGGDLIYPANRIGVDLVITGDVKLNIAQDAKAMNMCLIDAGHYGTEKIFGENIKEQFDLMAVEQGFVVQSILAKSNTNPFNL